MCLVIAVVVFLWGCLVCLCRGLWHLAELLGLQVSLV